MKKIPLRNVKKEIIAYAIIDDEDFDFINQYKWHLSEGYAVRTVNRRDKIQMHNMIYEKILGRKIKFLVDHEDRNKLNNCRNNLREATYIENSLNRSLQTNNKSGYSGVTIRKRGNKILYEVFSGPSTLNNRKYFYIGCFYDIRLAAICRDIWMKEKYKSEYIRLNIEDATTEEINFVKSKIDKKLNNENFF